MRGPRKEQDFQKFYYTYVGKGEACGCAERVIDIAEFERKSREIPTVRRLRIPAFLRTIFSRAKHIDKT